MKTWKVVVFLIYSIILAIISYAAGWNTFHEEKEVSDARTITRSAKEVK